MKDTVTVRGQDAINFALGERVNILMKEVDDLLDRIEALGSRLKNAETLLVRHNEQLKGQR